MVIILKTKIIGVHPLVGEITNKDIINDIALITNDYNLLVKYISNIIDLNKDNNELVDFLLDNNIGDRLANISYILETLL